MSAFKIESGVQLLARLTKKPNIENFYPNLFQSGPKSGDIVEIFSDGSTSHLLIDIISEALIQTKLNEVAAGVVIFNTDGNLNINELIETLRRKTYSMFNKNLSENVDISNILHEMLANLHILNIYDAMQLYTSIYNLESTLIQHVNISIIIFDTLTAFYWSEQGFKITKMSFYIKNLINIIQKVTREYRTTCIYTRPEYFDTNKDFDNIQKSDINYQIQILDNSKGNQVNIKTTSMRMTKFFKVVDGDLKWI